MKNFAVLSFILLLALSNLSCSVYKTIVNVSRLKFKLGSVENIELSDVKLDNKKSLSDFNSIEVIKLTASVARRSMPLTFILNVEAINPNDGTGGYPRTDITLKSFPWKLYIDDKETVSGNIEKPVVIPGTDETVKIPIRADVDLFKFFRDKEYEDLVNLALAINRTKGTSAKLVLYAQPTVTTPIGDITYPGQLKIVGMNFTN